MKTNLSKNDGLTPMDELKAMSTEKLTRIYWRTFNTLEAEKILRALISRFGNIYKATDILESHPEARGRTISF